jgi:hypothetical protein
MNPVGEEISANVLPEFVTYTFKYRYKSAEVKEKEMKLEIPYDFSPGVPSKSTPS